MPGAPATAIAATCRHSAAHAATVAHELGLKLADAAVLARGPAPYLLCEALSQGLPRISIRIPRDAEPSFSREADVSTDVPAIMRRKRYSRSDPMLRSVGPVRRSKLSFVVDATAGLGEDALMLAHGGHHVAMVERCPAVFATLRNGIERARSTVRSSLGASPPLSEAAAPRLSPPHRSLCSHDATPLAGLTQRCTNPAPCLRPPRRQRRRTAPDGIRVRRRVVGCRPPRRLHGCVLPRLGVG